MLADAESCAVLFISYSSLDDTMITLNTSPDAVRHAVETMLIRVSGILIPAREIRCCLK